MQFQEFLNPIISNWVSFALLIGLLILVKILASPTFKGWLGENVVRRGLSRLDPKLYNQFHDLYLPHPDGNGTTQIDHVVVSQFGVFVIETKNYKGWIFGSAKQPQWTQQIFKKKHRFQNPLIQNHLHIRALMDFLCTPKDRFHSVVFFIGENEFKTEMPDNVINRGLSAWINKHQKSLMSPDIVQNINARLAQLDRSTNRKSAAKAHVAALETRLAR